MPRGEGGGELIKIHFKAHLVQPLREGFIPFHCFIRQTLLDNCDRYAWVNEYGGLN